MLLRSLVLLPFNSKAPVLKKFLHVIYQTRATVFHCDIQTPRRELKIQRTQGSKKVPSGRPGQEDFLSGQVTFHSHLPNGQGIRQAVCQLSH